MSVVATGMWVLSRNRASSSQAPELMIPPPARTMGRSALRMADASFLIWPALPRPGV